MSQRNVVVYSADYCPFCQRAKALLAARGIEFQLIDVEAEPEKRAEMMQRSGQRTIPQVFVGDHHVGGCDQLMAADKSGELSRLLGD